MKKEDINTVEEEKKATAPEKTVENTDSTAPATEETADNAEVDDCNEGEATPAEEQDPLEAAKAEIEELKKQALYKQAEFDNYRKRTIKEKADLILAGGEKVIKEILPVLDDFERALQDKSDDPAAIREGVQLIFSKFIKTLEQQGVKKIETENADFDVDFHEAIAQIPGMGEDKKNKVIDCVQTGYTLNGKVIRYAKVAVGQ